MTSISRAPIDLNHHKGMIIADEITGEAVAVQGTGVDGAVNVNVVSGSGGGGNGAIEDGANPAVLATVLDLSNANPLTVAITDASGDQITSFGGGTQYADGAARGTATGTLAMVDDGTNIQSLSGDSSGRLNVNNISGTISLPTGAATSALQTTGNTSLATIAGAVSGTEMQVDVLTMPTVTVTATDLDIRNLVQATDSVSIGDGTNLISVSTAGADDVSNTQNTLNTNARMSYYDGTTWDRARGTSADGLLVNLGANNDVTVTGTVTANAGTNLNTSALNLETTQTSVLTSLQTIDDWDESDRAKVNLIVGQAGIAGGTGVDGATVPRVTLATNVGLPAGTNNIGDVDVLTIPGIVGTVADDSTTPGNPVMVGGSAKSPDGTDPSSVAENDVARVITDLNRRVYVNDMHPRTLTFHSDGSSALTDQSVAADPGDGFQIVVTSIIFSTGAATACNIFFEEGSTKVLGPWYLEAVAGRGVFWQGYKPITASTALTVTTSAAIAQCLDVTYFIQAV